MEMNSSLLERKWLSLSPRQIKFFPFLLLAFFFTNALHGAVRNSAVCDELGAHIPCGYLYWASGSFSGGIHNPPLGQLIIALPVKLLGYSYNLFTEQHLLLFRLPVLLMGLLLGVLVYRFASELYGRNAGLAALFLFALSPNILAHSSLATLDLPITFFVLLSVYFLYRYVQKPSVLSIILFSLALSGAILAKVQGLSLIPVTLLAFVVFLKKMMPAGRHKRLLFFTSWLLIPVIVFLSINLAYLHLPLSIKQCLPPKFINAMQVKLLHIERGHFAYLLGEYSDKGWWYYFPVAILLKTPLPALIFLAIGLLRKHSLKTSVFVLVPVALFLGAAVRSGINIGLRHILIIYPFLFILGGYGMTKLWKAGWQKAVLIILAIGYCAQAVFTTPHHLSYFNVLVGGPANGYKYLIDSNFDWGQNDHFLRRYIESNKIQQCKINPNPFRPTSGHIFVNANALYGVAKGGEGAYAWLKSFKPTRQIAYTWFEYYIPEEAISQQPEVLTADEEILVYVYGISERFSDVNDAILRLMFAFWYSALGANEMAFDEIRSILQARPDFEPAIQIGGEIIVNHKLGMLKYEGDEYLTGFKSKKPADGASIDEAKIIQLAKLTGCSQSLSQLNTELGIILLGEKRTADSIDALRSAIKFNPENKTALSLLPRVEADNN
jgi:tetratricopeptide (TPR) repeat protein